jgi:hypothetical protein
LGWSRLYTRDREARLPKRLRELTLSIDNSASEDKGLRVLTLSINSSVSKDEGEYLERLII